MASTSPATTFGGLAVPPAAGRLIWPTTTARARRRGGRQFRATASGGSADAADARRSADPDQQPAVHGGRRRRRPGSSASIPRRRPTSISRCTPLCCCEPERRERAYLDQNYYWIEMMARLRPGVSRDAGAGRARAALHAVGRRHGGERSRAREPPVLRLEDGAGGLDTLRRQVLEAALRPAGDGGPDPGDRVRQHGQSAARARGRPQARDGRAAQHRRRTLPRRSASC